MGVLRRDRTAAVVLAVAAVVYAVVFRAVSRPMGDSVSYRAAAHTITSGWHHLTDRTPGYPLLLWATGSVEHETRLLFAVQLALHVLTVLGAISLARTAGVGPRGRLAVTVLLVTPPVMGNVALAGTETVTAALLVALAWCLVRAARGGSAGHLWGAGAAAGGLVLVRPSYQLLWAVLAAIVLWWWRAEGWRTRLAAVGRVAAPSVLLVAALVTWNGVRFDSPAVTPMTPWHLSTKTALWVEELPPSEEPIRSALIRSRDRRFLTDEDHDPADHAFQLRDDLGGVAGLSDRELDRRMLRLQLRLLAERPFSYVDAVGRSGVKYAGPHVVGRDLPWDPLTSPLGAVHYGLVALFAVAATTLAGLALAGRRPSRAGSPLVVAAVLAAYTAAVTCMGEVGAPRVRSATDPLLVLLLVAGLAVLRSERRRARMERRTQGG